jgi:hypothetical protein
MEALGRTVTRMRLVSEAECPGELSLADVGTAQLLLTELRESILKHDSRVMAARGVSPEVH